MSLEIDYNHLLSIFDKLALQGIIHYGPSTVVQLTDEGFTLEFRISPSLLTKPQAEEDLQIPEKATEDAIAARPLCFGPGSDIANGHPDILIATVNNTHLLVINKFCVFRPQLLLLAADSYRRQHEPLCLDDLEAAWTVLGAVDSPHYAMYNCTLAAGASREHKHMHIIPRPGSHQKDEGGFRLFPDCESPDLRDAPFRYFKRDLYGSDLEKPISSKALLKIYLDLLAQTRTALGISNESPQSICPHNVVLVKEWIVVVPRRSNDFKSVTANAAGMMGSVWLMNEGQLDRWKSLGLRNVLSHLGVPAQEGGDAGSV